MKEEKLKKRLFVFLSVVIFLAILDSIYLTYLHYSEESSFCDISASLNCDVVNRGEFSTLDGVINHFFGTYIVLPIPNAVISIVVFLIIYLCLYLLYSGKRIFNIRQGHILNFVKSLLIISIIYALILIYIEAFILYTFCILCLALDILIILTTIGVWLWRWY